MRPSTNPWLILLGSRPERIPGANRWTSSTTLAGFESTISACLHAITVPCFFLRPDRGLPNKPGIAATVWTSRGTTGERSAKPPHSRDREPGDLGYQSLPEYR